MLQRSIRFLLTHTSKRPIQPNSTFSSISTRFQPFHRPSQFFHAAPLLLATGQDFSRIPQPSSSTSSDPASSSTPSRALPSHDLSRSMRDNADDGDSGAHKLDGEHLTTWTPTPPQGGLMNIYGTSTNFFDPYASLNQQFSATDAQKQAFKPIKPQPTIPTIENLTFFQKIWRFPSWLFRWILYKLHLRHIQPTYDETTLKHSDPSLAVNAPFCTFSSLTFPYIRPTVTPSEISRSLPDSTTTESFADPIAQLSQSSKNISCLIYAYILMYTYPSLTADQWRLLSPQQQFQKFKSCSANCPFIDSLAPSTTPLFSNFFQHNASVVSSYIGMSLTDLDSVLVHLTVQMCQAADLSYILDYFGCLFPIMTIVNNAILQHDSPKLYCQSTKEPVSVELPTPPPAAKPPAKPPALSPSTPSLPSTNTATLPAGGNSNDLGILHQLRQRLKSYQTNLSQLTPQEQQDYESIDSALNAYTLLSSEIPILYIFPQLTSNVVAYFCSLLEESFIALGTSLQTQPHLIASWIVKTNTFEMIPKMAASLLSTSTTGTKKRMIESILETTSKYSQTLSHPVVDSSMKYVCSSNAMTFLSENGFDKVMPFSPFIHTIVSRFNALFHQLSIDKLMVYQAIQSQRFIIPHQFFQQWSGKFDELRHELIKLDDSKKIVFKDTFFNLVLDAVHSIVALMESFTANQVNLMTYDWAEITDLALRQHWDIQNW